MSANGETSKSVAETAEVVDCFGSFIRRGPCFSVLQPRGPLRHRQELATQLRCVCYAEAHLNSFSKPVVQHAFVITSKTPHHLTEVWASRFLENVREAFGHKSYGVLRGGKGSGNVSHVHWRIPAMLLEPGFISEPEFVRILSTGEGLDQMGKCLADSVASTFDRGLVALSIGHAYRGSGDMGAFAAIREDPAFDQEAELCEGYVVAATDHLIGFSQ